MRSFLILAVLLCASCAPPESTCNNYRIISGYFKDGLGGWSSLQSKKVCVVSDQPYTE